MSDDFSWRAAPMTGPALRAADVDPSDAQDLPGGVCRSLYVGTGGDLRIMLADGGEVTLMSGDFQYHPVRVRRVLATGTSATRVVALY